MSVVPDGSAKEYDYICTPEGLSAIAVKTNGSRSLYYVQTDHLGSIRVVTTASKAIQTRYYYDAWGKQTLMTGTSITNRGYLAQEHLNDFGLINLNARLYDPVLARFMGVDPYVQAPDFTQSFNRYAYGLNNPLIYADPDGEWIEYVIAAVFLYVMNAYNNGDKTRDENGHQRRNYDLGSWAWNPLDWFKSTPENPNPSVVVTVTGNSDGDISGSIAAGNPNSSMPAIGYSNNQGLGFGYSYNGNTNMYYPGYNYNAPEQAAARAYEEAQSYFIEVNRFAESLNATVSQFYAYGPIPWRPVSGYILEPGGPSTTLSGQDKRIPAGFYDVSPYSSKKHPNVYIISGDQVSYNRRILIHSGNYHTHTLGCFLPGNSYSLNNNDYSVSGSRAKLNELRRLLQTNSATMIVRDINPK